MKKILSLLVIMTLIFSNVMVTMAAQPYDLVRLEANYYAQNNPDVVRAMGNSRDALVQHFLNNGRKEGRWAYAPAPSGTLQRMPDGGWFDAVFYANRYPDVRNAFGTDPTALYNHFVNNGLMEGRYPYAQYVAPAVQAPQPAQSETCQRGDGKEIYGIYDGEKLCYDHYMEKKNAGHHNHNYTWCACGDGQVAFERFHGIPLCYNHYWEAMVGTDLSPYLYGWNWGWWDPVVYTNSYVDPWTYMNASGYGQTWGYCIGCGNATDHFESAIGCWLCYSCETQYLYNLYFK